MFRVGGDSCEKDETEVKQELAERFIHCLDDKKEEWNKNWKIGNGACNGISNRKYAGLNRFLLTFTVRKKNMKEIASTHLIR